MTIYSKRLTPTNPTCLAFVCLAATQLVGAGCDTHGIDAKFGDQHLKTTVALVELHRVRTGKYPRSLTELKYTGDWDQIALNNVRYCPSVDQKTYYVEVTHGWGGKPELKIPPEFWTGTGFRAFGAKDCPAK